MVVSNRYTSWKTMETCAMRSSVRRSRTSAPPTRTVPLATSQKRATSRVSVDLPEPEGPTSAVTERAGKVSVTSWMTSRPGT